MDLFTTDPKSDPPNRRVPLQRRRAGRARRGDEKTGGSETSVGAPPFLNPRLSLALARQRILSTRVARFADKGAIKAPRVAPLYVVTAPQLFVSIRHAGFISAVSACTKTLFSIAQETRGGREGRAQQYGVYSGRRGTRGTRDVRAIGSDCNCCDSLQITVRHSLPYRPPFSSLPPVPRRIRSLYLLPSLPPAPHRQLFDSVMRARASLPATEIQCCVSARYVNVPLMELHATR